MSPQTSEQFKTAPPPSPVAAMPSRRPEFKQPNKPVPASGEQDSRLWFWLLVALGGVLNLVLIGMVYNLFNVKKVDPPESRRINVPYADSKELLEQWRSWPIQAGGRQKPFGVFCSESVRQITGREKFEKNDPVAVVLSWMLTYRGTVDDPDLTRTKTVVELLGCDWERYPFILCDYHELRSVIWTDTEKPGVELSEEDQHGKYVEPWRIRKSVAFNQIVDEARKAQEVDAKARLPMIQKKAMDVWGRLQLYDIVRSGKRDGQGKTLGVVALDEVGNTWTSLGELLAVAHSSMAERRWLAYLENVRTTLWEEYRGTPVQPYPKQSVDTIAAAFEKLQDSYVYGEEVFKEESENFRTAVAQVSNTHRPSYPDTDKIALELTFNKVQPFKWAWIAALFGTILLVGAVFTLDRSALLGRVLHIGGIAGFVAGLGIAGYGFYCRVSISGRPPVSDMYESIIWVAFMTGIFGMILELIYRRAVIALAAAVVSTAAFVLADQLPTVFESNIKPLEPVLQSNYWLLIHVLTIVSSYAALALAWGLGNINIALILFAPQRQALIKTLSHYSYKAIQIGVVLLFAGTMLGGWWANESWGRFWGWDPKEVWALIAFLCYIIPLHARYVGWVGDFGLAACSVICFAAVGMAWYGVNFILGAGLHSYGFGSGNNDWVYFFCVLNVSLVVHAGMRYMTRRNSLAMD